MTLFAHHPTRHGESIIGTFKPSSPARPRIAWLGCSIAAVTPTVCRAGHYCLPVQTLLIPARFGFGLDCRMVNGEPAFQHFGKSTSYGFGVGAFD